MRNLARQGVEVRVLTSARHADFEAMEEEWDGIRYYRSAKPQGFLNRLQLKIPFWRERVMTQAIVERLEDIARDFNPELIHAHSPFFNGQAALQVGKKLGIPVVYEIRAFWEDDAVDKGKFKEEGFVYKQVKRLETEVVKEATRVVCICEGLRQDLVARGISADKIVVVKNGVEVQTFAPRPKDPALEAKYGLAGKKVFGFIGSFFFYEGLPLLIEAIARLKETRDDFALLLVGAGEDEDRVKAKIAALGLNDLVTLAGRVPHGDIQDHYALIDVLCYPRHSKRLTELVTPLKPLEAMAMERVCLGSDVGGIRELFDECEVGQTFVADDLDDLVRLMGETLDRSSTDLEAEGHRGRQEVRTKRHWENTLEPLLAVYGELLGGRDKDPSKVGAA